MKVHLRADSANGVHTRFTVFMNGGNCGELCMSEKEAIYFHEIFIRTEYKIPGDEVVTSGHWFWPREGLSLQGPYSKELYEKCGNCGRNYGEHLFAPVASYPRNYCPGPGKMNWDEGPGTVFKSTGNYPKREEKNGKDS